MQSHAMLGSFVLLKSCSGRGDGSAPNGVLAAARSVAPATTAFCDRSSLPASPEVPVHRSEIYERRRSEKTESK